MAADQAIEDQRVKTRDATAETRRKRDEEDRKTYERARLDQKRDALLAIIEAVRKVPAAEPNDNYTQAEEQAQVLRAAAEFCGLRQVTREITAHPEEDTDQS